MRVQLGELGNRAAYDHNDKETLISFSGKAPSAHLQQANKLASGSAAGRNTMRSRDLDLQGLQRGVGFEF